MTTDEGAVERMAEWRRAIETAPRRGAYVEIGRILSGDHEVTALDRLWWYPEVGNWNLEGMFWRPAREPDA